MSIEQKGPGGVSASYGKRTTQASGFDLGTKYDDVYTPKAGTSPVIVDSQASGQLDRAVARMRGKFNKGVTRVIGVGDSYMAASGASSLATSMYGLTKKDFSDQFVFSNFGNSGKTVPAYLDAAVIEGDAATNLRKLSALPDDIFFGVWGLNDVRGVNYAGGASGGPGSNPLNFPQFQAKAQAVATALLVPEAARTRAKTLDLSAPNPKVTYFGSWNHGTTFGPSMSYSDAAGSTASFKSPKGNLLIIRFGADTASSNLNSVTVDGEVMGSWSSGTQYDSWSRSCVIIPLKTNKEHDVVLTQIGTGNLMWEDVDCVDTDKDFGGTLLYSGPAYLLDSAGSGWSNTGGIANGATANSATGISAYLLNNGGCDRFTYALEAAMDDLFNYGFNVVNVKARSGFNPVYHTSSGDRVHPNDLGHEHLSKPFRQALSKLSTY